MFLAQSACHKQRPCQRLRKTLDLQNRTTAALKRVTVHKKHLCVFHISYIDKTMALVWDMSLKTRNYEHRQWGVDGNVHIFSSTKSKSDFICGNEGMHGGWFLSSWTMRISQLYQLSHKCYSTWCSAEKARFMNIELKCDSTSSTAFHAAFFPLDVVFFPVWTCVRLQNIKVLYDMHGLDFCNSLVKVLSLLIN